MSVEGPVSTCQNCGKEFTQRYPYPSKWTKTCSHECRGELSAKTTKASSGRWAEKDCPRCGTTFTYAVNKPKTYCTWDCMMAARTEDSRASRLCEVCGSEFTYFKRQDQRTCSPACRNKLTAMRREINYPECKVCGVSTGSYNRIYCDEHRPSRPGRKPMPRKTAVCQGCGEEFSRPGTWPGKMLFCSTECSKKDPSYRRIKRYSFGNLNAEGGYELRFLACLQRLNIDWEPWPDSDPFRYICDDGKERTYTPDFLVDGKAIEVKGWEENPKSTQRAAHEQWSRPEPLVIVNRDTLADLEHIFNQRQFLDILTALSTTQKG